MKEPRSDIKHTHIMFQEMNTELLQPHFMEVISVNKEK